MISELIKNLNVKPVGKFVYEESGKRYHHIRHGEYKYTVPKLPRFKLYPHKVVNDLLTILSLMQSQDMRSHSRRCELEAELADRNGVILEQHKQIAALQARIDERPVLPEMNDDLLFILGKPCFQCASIAQILRMTGEDIQPRAESEQAAVIHWMLSYYLKHGENWKAAANADLKERQDHFKTKEIAP